MKTIITVTNCTKELENYMKALDIEEESLVNIISSRNRNGIYLIKENAVIEQMDSINVINLFIDPKEINPAYDISLPEEKAKALISDVFSAKEIPYCELTSVLFKRQKDRVNDCVNCFVTCPHRISPYERNDAINTIYDAYCKEIYETCQNEFEGIKIALVKGWPTNADKETLQKYAMTEDELFADFIENGFNRFVFMAPLIHNSCPQFLHYYFHYRKFSLREFLVDKYTLPW